MSEGRASAMDTVAGPLRGLQVLELGRFSAGLFCTRLLGDLVAQAIEAKPPGQGDPSAFG